MSVLSLPGYQAKVRRAEEHLQAIQHSIRAWHDTHPYRFTRQSNADRTRHSIIARFDSRPPIEHLSLLSGDCSHGLRSALDHLVYAIAVYESGADPPPNERRLQFPITDTAELFQDQVWRIKALSTPVRAAIEACQPYNRRHKLVPPLLSILRDFDDTDKHRLLNVVVSAQFEGELRNLSYPIPPGQSISVYFFNGEIEDGTETFAVITPTPDPNVTYNLALKLGVAIRHGIGPDGADSSEVGVLLSYIRDEVNFVSDVVSGSV